MNIIKGPPRGYAKTIAEKRRQTLPGLPTGLERVVATMAKPESPGCIVTYQNVAVDISDTAMKAGKSPRVDEQRTAIILAQIAAVAYAQDAGEKPEVCWAALQGVAMLQQAFDGDFSDPRWPVQKSVTRAKSYHYHTTGHVLSLIRMRESLDATTLVKAIERVVLDLDTEMTSKIGIRIWDVSFKTENRDPGRLRTTTATDQESRAEVEKRLLNYIKAEDATTRTDKAMPAESSGAAFYAVTRRLLARKGANREFYTKLFEDTFRELVVMTPAAQAALVAMEPQESEDQNPPGGFATRKEPTFADMRTAPDITDL